MNQKLKICTNCKKPRRIWKSSLKGKFCKFCWFKLPENKPKVKLKIKLKKISVIKKKRISPISEKRIIANKKYSKLRKKFLEEKPECEAHLTGICTSVSTEVHHLYSGKDRAAHYLDVPNWKSICRSCHTYLHVNTIWARKNNLLK